MVETSVCEEKHKRIDEKFETHEGRLNNHSERLDKLERYQSKAEEQVSQLCKKLDALVKAMWWAMGLVVSTLLGFFVWYVQTIGR